MTSICWIALTERCNNRCSHCYQSREGAVDDMSLDTLASALEYIAGLGCRRVVLLGGEPLLSPVVYDAIEGALARDMMPSLVTNGTLLTDRVVRRLVDAGLRYLTVSVEGDEVQHDSVTRRRSSFEETVRGLSVARGMGLQVSTMTTISVCDPTPYYRMLDRLEGHSVSSRFNFVVPPVGRSVATESPMELGRVASDLLDYSDRVSVNATIPLCALGPLDRLLEYIAAGRIRVGCQVIHENGIAVNPDGGISPCTHFDGRSVGSIGMPIPELRSSLTDVGNAARKYPSSACAGCGLSGYCLGGCPLFRVNRDAGDWEIRGFDMSALEIAQRIEGLRFERVESPVTTAARRAVGAQEGQKTSGSCDDGYTPEEDAVAIGAAAADCCDYGCDR